MEYKNIIEDAQLLVGFGFLSLITSFIRRTCMLMLTRTIQKVIIHLGNKYVTDIPNYPMPFLCPLFASKVSMFSLESPF